jgi:phage terminase large subunit-like protein
MTPKRKKSPPDPHAQPAGYYFDDVEADRVVRFFSKYLRHNKGELAGRPFELVEWQRRFSRELFGAKRERDKRRRYRRAYCEIARKNGKTTLGAGYGLYLLFADGEPGAEIYSAAGDKDQARLIHDIGRGMVEGHPQLRQRCKLYKDAIVVEETQSVWRVLSSEAFTKHGLNASAILFDELHVQPNRELWDVLTTSTGARSQPLTLAITTAGYDRNSLCWEQHDYAEKVRDRIIEDPEFLPLIFAADPELDFADPKAWEQANPNIGISIRLDYLEAEARRAQQTPGYVNTFRRLQLNQWTESDVRWLDMDAWDRCAGKPIALSDVANRRCKAGLDLATTRDLTAFVMVFPNSNGSYDVLPVCWIPEESARARELSDRVPYSVWIREGLIRTTRGNTTDYATVRRDINALADMLAIEEIAVDRLFQGAQLATELQDDGFNVVSFGQGFYSMAAPTQELERLVLEGKLHHGGHPVLRWHASNITVEIDDAGNMKPSKKKSTERIDLMVGTIMGLGRLIAEPSGESVYEQRGVLEI